DPRPPRARSGARSAPPVLGAAVLRSRVRRDLFGARDQAEPRARSLAQRSPAVRPCSHGVRRWVSAANPGGLPRRGLRGSRGSVLRGPEGPWWARAESGTLRNGAPVRAGAVGLRPHGNAGGAAPASRLAQSPVMQPIERSLMSEHRPLWPMLAV